MERKILQRETFELTGDRRCFRACYYFGEAATASAATLYAEVTTAVFTLFGTRALYDLLCT